jgi:hypothetical protein
MFGENLGNIILNSTGANSTMTHQFVQKGQEGDGKLGNLYFVAIKRTNDNTLIVKLANIDPNDILVKAKNSRFNNIFCRSHLHLDSWCRYRSFTGA